MKNFRCYDRMTSPLGDITLYADDAALAAIYFADEGGAPAIDAGMRREPLHPAIQAGKAQLIEYFAGARRTFELPLAVRGTPFQRAVWNAIAAVPYGATIAYRELATRVAAPTAMRAAGAATGRNPWMIVVPCHRIVGSDGTLTGYAGGLERKRALLALEASNVPLVLAA